ncbi:hypothetical protein ACQKLP_08640 [Chitinophaga sp. NPDC101104]|uniref:hypothetical protein n=1 Tax=Chitinophaga sp. NPDC101104 TaxID=3390561 RepID=UPI003D02AA60
MKNTTPAENEVIFIQYDIPPLKAAEYTITVKQQTNQQPGEFSASRKFAVTSERFTLDPDDINSNFPQNLANGEFGGTLPHVLFNRRILPWERNSVNGDAAAPWLAVLLFGDGEQPTVVREKAKALVPAGTDITVAGSTITGTGTMPAGTFSYPGMQKLDYGETPDDDCNIIDIPAALFNQIAPTKKDLPFLAHIRKMQTLDKTDNLAKEVENFTVVLGNRLPQNDSDNYAFLVSLENFGDYLPDDDGKSNLPAGITTVRLLTYIDWSYTVNSRDETFKSLLEHLNKNELDQQGLTVLQVPFKGTPPTTDAVKAALEKQALGTLSPADATVLVQNAIMMGYTPHGHSLRHSGHTVSWYRSPLLPYLVKETIEFPVSCSDAANRYNPDTGLFDISYGAAWQLGQLLALQNKNFASSLYNWKKGLYAWQVIEEENKIIQSKYQGIEAFGDVFAARSVRMEKDISPPEDVVNWMARLSLLNGVPFNYLVADERMLPPESLRFFYIDNNWVDALMDGAFSIGRSTTASMLVETPYLTKLRVKARKTATQFRKRKQSLKGYVNNTGTITGFLLRSAVLKGWPGMEITGYDDAAGTSEIQQLRMERLSEEVLLCIFDGVVQRVSIHEPPEALHSGVEGAYPDLFTTLRVVQGGGDPGSGIDGYTAKITTRSNQQTLQVSKSADAIKTVLNAPPLSEGITDFTAAQFALEMIKGVVKVDFLNTKA